MSKNRQRNKEIYFRNRFTYKWNTDYEPAMYDTMLDYRLMYGDSPKPDKNDYTKSVREYKKNS